MFRETRPETVVIGTVDATHVEYIEKALAAGVHCISEKPLCIDAAQCRRIRAAQARAAGLTAVTAHNRRYAPASGKIRELVVGGAVGDVRSIVYQELLDQRHGSSYFRRWNREKRNSGGLLVHKACHDFDAINWWVGSRAVEVSARGSLTAYGPGASPLRGERCCACPHAEQCPQHVDLANDNFRGELYFRAREEGSYTPDLCVFDPAIDSEDHATLAVTYENGVRLTYDLCAYAAYEGARVDIEGSAGRLEYRHRMGTAALAGTAEHGVEATTDERLTLFRFEQAPEDIPIPEAEGGHGGADPGMLADLFGQGPPSDARASLEDGIQAVLIGAAANVSIAEDRPVDVQGLMGDG
jgi:predicted dehydrogenase